jgi:hypothetical protein
MRVQKITEILNKAEGFLNELRDALAWKGNLTEDEARAMLGCADEDSAYLSKRMLRVGTSDDAPVSTVVNMPKGRDNSTFLSRLSYP